MDITNDTPEVDYDTAFDEAVGDAVVGATPISEPPAAEGEGDDVGGVTGTGEEHTEGDQVPAAPAEGEGAPPADGEVAPVEGEAPSAEGGEVPATPQPAVAPVEPAPVPQQPIDPKYLAAAILELQQQQSQSPKAEPEEPEAPKVYTAEDFLDEKQKAAIQVFEQEWSEVQAPVTALIQAHVQAALANNKQELLHQVHQSLAPIQQVAAQSQEAMWWATVQAAHPDARDRISEVKAWIDQQPSLIRPHLERVFQQGDAAETVELLDVFKKATGSTGAAPAQPASSAAQVPQPRSVPKPALSATLAPPAAQRSTPTDSRDPNDFDRAFEEAVSGR